MAHDEQTLGGWDAANAARRSHRVFFRTVGEQVIAERQLGLKLDVRKAALAEEGIKVPVVIAYNPTDRHGTEAVR